MFLAIFVIYVFVNAQKVVHPRGVNHVSFVISAVTTTQYSMRKLEKLELTKSHQPNVYISQPLPQEPDIRSNMQQPSSKGLLHTTFPAAVLPVGHHHPQLGLQLLLLPLPALPGLLLHRLDACSAGQRKLGFVWESSCRLLCFAASACLAIAENPSAMLKEEEQSLHWAPGPSIKCLQSYIHEVHIARSGVLPAHFSLHVQPCEAKSPKQLD